MNPVQCLYINIRNKFTTPVFLLCIVGLFVYLPAWLWTISIAETQVNRSEVTLPVLGSDSLEYAVLSKNLNRYHCFSLDQCNTPETFRTIGYPLFVSIHTSLFQSLFAVTFIQCLLSLVTGYVLFKILSRFVPYRVAVVGMILFLLNPNVLQHSLLVLSDILFLFLIVCAFYLMMIPDFPRRFFYVGIMLGVSVLVRPVSMFILPIYIGAYYWLHKPTFSTLLRNVMLTSLSFGMIMFPWVIRNYVETGVCGVSSVSGYNLMYYNVPMFVAQKTGQDVNSVRDILIQRTDVEKSRLRDLAMSDVLMRGASTELLNDPLGYTAYHISKTIPFFFGSSIKNAQLSYNLFYNDDVDKRFSESSISDKLLSLNIEEVIQYLLKEGVVLVERLGWLFMVILAFIGMYDTQRRKWVIISVLYIAYFALLTGPVSYVRYRLPAEPFLFMAALVGATFIFERLSSRSKS